MTAEDIIKTALRKIRVKASGENPTPEELQDGLSVLQTMLRAWAINKYKVFYSPVENISIIAGTHVYTFGSGGAISTTRPNKINTAYIKDSLGYSHPVDVVSYDWYKNIADKQTTGRPVILFYNPTYPLGEITLYPIPDTSETLVISSEKPFTETSSFDALASSISFPSFYEEAIIYNLAIRLADEYGKEVTVSIAEIATSNLRAIASLNAASQVTPVKISVPGDVNQRDGYNINRG